MNVLRSLENCDILKSQCRLYNDMGKSGNGSPLSLSLAPFLSLSFENKLRVIIDV